MESSNPTNPRSIAIYMVLAAALLGVGGGSALLYREYGQPLFEPPPPVRVNAKIIQDAWINVAPPERFTAAKAMVQCLQARKPDEKEETLRTHARLCELEVIKKLPKEREAGLEAAKRRLLATQSFWPEEQAIEAKDYAAPAPTPSKPVNRWDKFGTPASVIAVWDAGATSAPEKAAAKVLADCLKLEALDGVNVPLLHKRASNCETLSALNASLDVEARNTVVFYRDKITSTYWLADKPTAMVAIDKNAPIVSATQTTAAAPAATVALAPTAASVELAWKQSTDPNELIAAAELSRCLKNMGGNLNASVLICELRAMNSGNNKAVDAVVGRRAQLMPTIKGPGARYTGEPAVAESKPTPAASSTPQANSATQAPATVPTPGTMSDGLPGASDLFAGWQKTAESAGTPQVAQMLIDCMKKTPAISQDTRGLKVSIDVCKLRVQVEIEKQSQASKALLELGKDTP